MARHPWFFIYNQKSHHYEVLDAYLLANRCQLRVMSERTLLTFCCNIAPVDIAIFVLFECICL